MYFVNFDKKFIKNHIKNKTLLTCLNKGKISKQVVEEFNVLVYKGKEPLGFCLYDSNKLYNIEIFNEFRGNNYGRELLESLERRLSDYGEIIVLHVMNEEFFLKMGYKILNDKDKSMVKKLC